MLVWVMLDGQIEGLLGNSFILRLCQRHYRLIPLYFPVAFIAVDGRFEREDGGEC